MSDHSYDEMSNLRYEIQVGLATGFAKLRSELRAGIASEIDAIVPCPPLQTVDYAEFLAGPEGAEQGSDLLGDKRTFIKWKELFFPSPLRFQATEPQRYPAVVVYTRIRGNGLSACRFYWDFVTQSDFAARTKPSTQPAAPAEPSLTTETGSQTTKEPRP